MAVGSLHTEGLGENLNFCGVVTHEAKRCGHCQWAVDGQHKPGHYRAGTT